ncbi:fumarylacetoacetate hydrolase family protein [Effusibacillus dendaii]|uniref:2-hydroxyhepta-2,4-diene-1,7-dioate isomerase n=1 Tax=Effusibacillus dendaii TaxID=2743772 RepID=A0A7I8DID6_9BACL|nr:fumarylacetoacetate hydrolase family protein [Effusibacillus dendaii]BCJ87601.1 2-hydroxyhepta-2,4-diene-1,7-dioate isomerase [Effusibacillus dendaii]
MRIIRFRKHEKKAVLAAVTDEDHIYSLPYKDFLEMVKDADREQVRPIERVWQILRETEPLAVTLEQLDLLVPIEAPEVWAAGVTYERSKEARNYESTGGKLDTTTFYDKVYEAERPELFLKSTAARTIGPNQPVCLRSDSNWQIPEPELGMVIDQNGRILGYTIGNDMSSRDIEGENPLYLPQAKVWRNSCAIGPAIRLAESVQDPYDFEIVCRIFRNGQLAIEGAANTRQLKRKLPELVSYLTRDNVVFDGTVLLTGTCIVPPNEFTLQDGDRIEIEISGIGMLHNPVQAQAPVEQQAG